MLESTAIYRAKGKNPFFGEDAERPSLGQILLMGKEALSRHVLANPRIDIYSCGARDIQSGAIDRRVLAPGDPDLSANRAVLLAGSAALLLLSWALLRRQERYL